MKRISQSPRTATIVALALLFTACNRRVQQLSSTMEPTIKAGEFVTSEYLRSSPNRWDVIIFEAPVGTGKWMSRVVGLPGETVDIKAGELVINGSVVPRPARLRIGSYEIPRTDLAPAAPTSIALPYKIRPGHYFMLGDNVSNSLDSRYWGGLPESDIVSRVIGK